MSLSELVLRWLPSLVLLGAASVKFMTGWEPGMVLGEAIYYFLAALECAAGVMLMLKFRGLRMLAYVGVMALALMGYVASFYTGLPCGCLGSKIRMNAQQHRLWAGSLGVIASLGLLVSLQDSGAQKRGALEA